MGWAREAGNPPHRRAASQHHWRGQRAEVVSGSPLSLAARPPCPRAASRREGAWPPSAGRFHGASCFPADSCPQATGGGSAGGKGAEGKVVKGAGGSAHPLRPPPGQLVRPGRRQREGRSLSPSQAARWLPRGDLCREVSGAGQARPLSAPDAPDAHVTFPASQLQVAPQCLLSSCDSQASQPPFLLTSGKTEAKRSKGQPREQVSKEEGLDQSFISCPHIYWTPFGR